MTTRRGTSIGVLLAAGVLTGLLSGCGGGSGAAFDLSAQVRNRLADAGTRIDANSFSCAGHFAARAGTTVRCGFTSGGQPVDAIVDVTSVDGAELGLKIATEARPVPREVLADSVSADVLDASGAEIDSATCANDLEPQVGQSTTCALAGGAVRRTVRVTVSSVEGGLVSYTING